MILHELTGTEDHQAYQDLEISNGNRHYDFLRSIVAASLHTQRQFLSTQIIKALNYHAIACLHAYAGEYRPCQVKVGDYTPPEHYRVQVLMDDFVNDVNRNWETNDPVVLSTFVLWKMNFIHPFINGNGRTARAASYFVLCVKSGQWLPGTTILPELIRQNKQEYVEALKAGDESAKAGQLDLSLLHALLTRLLQGQIGTEPQPEGADPNNNNSN